MRKKLKHSRDKKVFARTAKRVKKVNINPSPMRGGIRL